MQLLKTCDLLIVMGTALMVAPFNLLVDMSPEAAPQILINRENTLPVYDFTKGPNRLFLPGNCDDTIMQIV
jgi:NAD-dependent SIR2 family protein deacetylase